MSPVQEEPSQSRALPFIVSKEVAVLFRQVILGKLHNAEVCWLRSVELTADLCQWKAPILTSESNCHKPFLAIF